MYSDIVVISENLFQISMVYAIMKWEAQFKRPSEFLEQTCLKDMLSREGGQGQSGGFFSVKGADPRIPQLVLLKTAPQRWGVGLGGIPFESAK